MPEDPLPYAGPGPAAEAGVHLLPIAEPFRQVAPGDARPVPVQHRLDERAVVLGRDPDPPLAPGQEVLDPVPLVVPQGVAAHRSVLLGGQPNPNRSPRRPIPQLRARPSCDQGPRDRKTDETLGLRTPIRA